MKGKIIINDIIEMNYMIKTFIKNKTQEQFDVSVVIMNCEQFVKCIKGLLQ